MTRWDSRRRRSASADSLVHRRARIDADRLRRRDRRGGSSRVRDLHLFEHAVADECAAVEKASAAVTDAVAAARHAAVEPPADSGSDLSIEHEHTRLFEQMEVLEREHRDLETRPRDLEAHRSHRARLHAHVARLRVHSIGFARGHESSGESTSREGLSRALRRRRRARRSAEAWRDVGAEMFYARSRCVPRNDLNSSSRKALIAALPPIWI